MSGRCRCPRCRRGGRAGRCPPLRSVLLATMSNAHEALQGVVVALVLEHVEVVLPRSRAATNSCSEPGPTGPSRSTVGGMISHPSALAETVGGDLPLVEARGEVPQRPLALVGLVDALQELVAEAHVGRGTSCSSSTASGPADRCRRRRGPPRRVRPKPGPDRGTGSRRHRRGDGSPSCGWPQQVGGAVGSVVTGAPGAVAIEGRPQKLHGGRPATTRSRARSMNAFTCPGEMLSCAAAGSASSSVSSSRSSSTTSRKWPSSSR